MGNPEVTLVELEPLRYLGLSLVEQVLTAKLESHGFSS